MKVQLNTLKAVAYRGVPVPADYLAKMRGATVLPPRYFVNAKQLRAKLDDLRADVARFVDTYGGTLTPEWRDLLDGAEIYALARQLEAFAMKNNPESRSVKI